MRRICIINQKGGVGKTTTTVNVATGLAKSGKKVLILDLDAQGNICSCLVVDAKKDMYDLLVEDAKLSDCICSVSANLDVLPSKETLTKAELILVGEQSRETLLKRKLAGISGYDYVLLDCPPSLGLLNQNALLYADEAVIPASTDVLGYEGLKKILAAINKINEVFDHEIKVTAIVPTLHDARNKICKDTLKRMNKEYYGLVTDPIRVNSKLKEAPSAKKSIFEYDKSGRGSKDYGQLVEFILKDDVKAPSKSGSVSRRLELASGSVLYKVSSAE